MRMSGFRQQTYSDQVDDYIKGRILSGNLAPDALNTQVAIAAKLSFSRAPVREAMQKLVLDGLIESHPKKVKNVTALMENKIKTDSSPVTFWKLRLSPTRRVVIRARTSKNRNASSAK